MMERISINDIKEYIHELFDNNNDIKSISEKKEKHKTERLEIHSKINIYKYPKCIKGKCKKEMTRIGIDYLNKKTNISFYSSLVYFINDKYEKLAHSDRITYITRLIEKIAKSATKKSMKTDIKENIVTDDIILYVADYLNLNIIVIDKDNDKLKIYSSQKNIHRYNNNIILFYYKSNYEPIIIEEKKLLSYNEIDCLICKDTVIISSEIDQVISDNENNTDDLFIKTEVNNKMKYDELAKIAKSHKIELYDKSKKKTKSILIDEINNIVKNN